MGDHLFFDLADLKHVGQNVIIGRTVRIRYPELVSIGDDTVIDDFTYISAACDLGRAIHIGPSCTFLGGRDTTVRIGDGVTVSAGVTFAGSDIPLDSIKGYSWFDGQLSSAQAHPGRVTVGDLAFIGANSVIDEDVNIGNGGFVGASSFIRHDVPAWEVWAGSPARKLGDRSPHAETLTDMWEQFARGRYGDAPRS